MEKIFIPAGTVVYSHGCGEICPTKDDRVWDVTDVTPSRVYIKVPGGQDKYWVERPSAGEA